jgi:hypothetical protein
MYESYNIEAKRAVLAFMNYYFPDPDRLVWPIHPVFAEVGQHEILPLLAGLEFRKGFRILQKYCREREVNIPPLISSYMQLVANHENLRHRHQSRLWRR